MRRGSARPLRILLASSAVVICAFVGIFLLFFTGGIERQSGPYVAIGYRITNRFPGTAPISSSKSVAALLGARFQLDIIPISPDRIEVRIPKKAGAPVVPVDQVDRLLVRPEGVQFRIAPYKPDSGKAPSIGWSEQAGYVQDLRADYPGDRVTGDKLFEWVAIPDCTKLPAGLVVAQQDGKAFLLVSRTPGEAMDQPDSAWAVDAFGYAERGTEGVALSFDPPGRRRLALLSAANKGRILAVCAAGMVYAAWAIEGPVQTGFLAIAGVPREAVHVLRAATDHLPFGIEHPPLYIKHINSQGEPE